METALQIMISGLLLGGVYILAAVGLTLMFGVAKIINFAHGEFLMLGMYATFWLAHLYGLNPYTGLLVIVPVSFLFGVVIYQTVIRHTIWKPEMTQVFGTLGLSIAFQNLALMVWTADYRSVKVFEGMNAIYVGPLYFSTSRLLSFIASLVIVASLIWFVRQTFLGQAIEAVSQDMRAARLMGIDVNRVLMVTFGMGTALTGLAGAMLMPSFYAFPTVGSYFVLVAFVVVVLGGLGNLYGAVIGGLIVGVVESAVGFFVPDLKEAAIFVAFVLVLAFRPHGIMGIKGSEKEALK